MTRRFTHRFHALILLSIVLACMGWSKSGWALELGPTDGTKAPVSLRGQLAVLQDTSGDMTIEDFASGRSSDLFMPLAAMVTEGYRRGAVWIRFSLSAPTAPGEWILQIERPLIESVTLFGPDATGRLAPVQPAPLPGGGEVRPAYPTLFPIAVAAEDNTYYLRLASSTSLTTALNIWKDDGYENYRNLDHWLIGIVIGAVAAMIFANLLYGYFLRESIHFVYIAVLVESALLPIFHLGYASELLSAFQPAQIHLSWGIIVCLYSIVMVWFMGRLFEFRRHSIWAWRAIQLFIALNAIALLFSLAGRYGDVGLFVSRLQQISYLFISAVVLYLLIVRRQHQYLFSAFAFSGVIIVSLVMQSQYLGSNFLGVDSSLARFMAIGTLAHLVLLSAAVAQRARQAEVDLGREKDRTIALTRAAERDLTIKVAERTSELATMNAALQQEVERRQELELKLRQSLVSINDALSAQRDFVALVSHEFRAPLSVIAAAADNLSMSASAGADYVVSRAAKIRQTVSRMSLLIENVLAGERLDSGRTREAAEPFELSEVLVAVVGGLDDSAADRIQLAVNGSGMVAGERNLIEIVVLNLIQNAIKYSPAASPVSVALATDGAQAIIDVTDHGGGVADEHRDLIFTKYYRGHTAGVSGSGLGLFISREVARHYGGELTLAASSEDGSTFRLVLPISGQAGA
ncbi:Signal transduction histidine kinase [Devosia enhydra]|uniref:histidine kinase n=2 Tax=Devosia enhydra TaxID=665118 RepID=A0A1K2I1V2_9HYPH|nr:Signal transduction histidine kinase [Devosia enhydra]